DPPETRSRGPLPSLELPQRRISSECPLCVVARRDAVSADVARSVPARLCDGALQGPLGSRTPRVCRFVRASTGYPPPRAWRRLRRLGTPKGALARWQRACRIDRTARVTQLEMQHHAIVVGIAHLGDLLALLHRFAFLHEQRAVVRVGR